jgi:hypothetical protein
MNQKPTTQLPSWPIRKNCELLIDREVVGLGKYGVTLGDAGLSHEALLQHGLEEALDLANYLQTALATERENAKYRAEHGHLLKAARNLKDAMELGLYEGDELEEALLDLVARYEIEAARRGIPT